MSRTLPAAYAGRTLDLVAFHGPGAAVEVLDPGNGGRVCTGFDKLAQLFAICLLTPRGSVPHDPDYGTGFLAAVRSGAIRTTTSLLAAFATAAQEAEVWFRRVETPDDPDDEILDRVEGLTATVGGGRASITYRIVTAAGEETTRILPVTVGEAA